MRRGVGVAGLKKAQEQKDKLSQASLKVSFVAVV
jgi:hypothetical protein